MIKVPYCTTNPSMFVKMVIEIVRLGHLHVVFSLRVCARTCSQRGYTDSVFMIALFLTLQTDACRVND